MCMIHIYIYIYTSTYTYTKPRFVYIAFSGMIPKNGVPILSTPKNKSTVARSI